MTTHEQDLNNVSNNQPEDDPAQPIPEPPVEPPVEPIDAQEGATTLPLRAAPITPIWEEPTLARLPVITRKLTPTDPPIPATSPTSDSPTIHSLNAISHDGSATSETSETSETNENGENDAPATPAASESAHPASPSDSTSTEMNSQAEEVDQQETLKLPSLHAAPTPDATPDTTPEASPGAMRAGDASVPGDLFLLPPLRVAQMRRELANKQHQPAWRTPVIVGALIILVAAPLLFVISRFAATEFASRGANHAPTTTAPAATPDTPAAWARDERQTPLNAQDAIFARQRYAVAPAFQAYYTHRNGTAWLGVALTPAFPTAEGLAQFFTNGALVLPGRLDPDDTPNMTTGAPGVIVPPGATTSNDDTTDAAPGDISPQLIRDGVYDAATGVEWLPLAHTLLTVGSEAHLVSGESASDDATYLSLRAATAPSAWVVAPPGSQTPSPASPTATATSSATATTTASATPTGATTSTPNATDASAPIFVAEATQNGQAVGHTIPAAIWAAINDPSVSPDGWQVDFGVPLTEALPLTTTTPDGQTHHLLAQLFWEGAILFDQDAYAADPTQSAAALAPLALGQAYLQTLGAPAPTTPKGQQIWATGDMAVLTEPTTGQPEVHIGLNFPLTITGGQWRQGALWYRVTWQSLRRSGDGWAAATALTLTPPGVNQPIWASFDALSPTLAAYLDGEGPDVGAVVYDLTRNTYYTYNGQSAFIMASSAKVSLMAEDLSGDEAQGVSPSPGDLATLTAMIEQSDNNAAQSIYDEWGDSGGVSSYLASVGINDYIPSPDGWGWAQWSPLSMVRLLTLLQTGQLLNASDTALALSLMGNIEPDQRNGVGDTAPSGATYAMKDGWVPGPDGLWAVNSSGIVTVGHETYIISVYSQEQDSLDGGWDITRQVCGPVGKLLT